ncbi:helix-turn-helix domain-containing protein [Paraburkholderia sp. EG287A]|uniref:helix-turn-helix domain-containing protein n=1 Tax=unclassified Paraburkholderia TaxID=2615204 RepID=UPI0034D387EA
MTREREWIPRPDAPQIAKRLRERREAVGLTQRELARQVGMAEWTYVRWELGRLPGSVAERVVRALEAALQVPEGWLLGHDVLPLPEPVFDAANVQVCGSGRDGLPARIPRAKCEELGPHARRLREELGLPVAEVARACGVSPPTLLQWEQGTFPKALTAHHLRAWARALLLAPEQLLALPVPHPGVRDGRWRVVIEAETLEDAIHRVAQCLATRGRNLLGPEQPLDKTARRNADLLAHRYGIGAHRWPLVDVAVSYGMAATHLRQTVAGLITRSARFAFEIPVLEVIVKAGGFSLATAATDVRVRGLLGPSLSIERAAAFAGEILSRRIAGADPRMAVARAQHAGDTSEQTAGRGLAPEAEEPDFGRSRPAEATVSGLAADRQADAGLKKSAEAIESCSADAEQHGLRQLKM